ncbi:MAG TPA: sigma-70 family RNA polymerase sigma factor [Thermoguttaceae bacterium]|nr:sigma-70 family RNA polymerase sigma factor [Thermoguttaceae bacterium]
MRTPDAESSALLSVDELISRILRGHTEFYEEIIRRYQQDVLQVVSGLLYDRGPAEDLVQEVFVSAYFALARFQTQSDFRPWIRTIARNAVREELRKKARYDRRLRTYGEMFGTRLADDGGAALHEETLAESLRRCVDRLPDRQATAIRLRYDQGETIEAIATTFGTSNGAIRNLLCHARASLRECTQREMNQP